MSYFVSDEILKQYENKDFEEIFTERGQLKIIENDFGEFLILKNPFGIISDKYFLSNTEMKFFKELAKRKLSILKGISKKKELLFKKKSINQLEHLIGLSPKYLEVEKICESIEKSEIKEISKITNLNDEDKIFCANKDQFIFLDIETTGQFGSELFLLGIGYFHDNKFQTELLFARDLSEEMALLRYFLEILEDFKIIVTYNGKTFDIPFIIERCTALFQTEDIKDIFDKYNQEDVDYHVKKEDLWPGEMVKCVITSKIHVDLYFLIKRYYKGILEDYRLTTAEEIVLGFFRNENLPSKNVPQVYLDWVENPDKFMGALIKVLEHNYYDVVNMEKLLKEYIILKIDEIYLKNGGNIKKITNKEKISFLITKFKQENKIKSRKIDDFF